MSSNDMSDITFVGSVYDGSWLEFWTGLTLPLEKRRAEIVGTEEVSVRAVRRGPVGRLRYRRRAARLR